MSAFILDASYTLTWCFSDRATANTDATLRRLEAREDHAMVPWVWQLEVGNGLGKAVTRAKLPLPRALEIWAELMLLPIRHLAIGDIPQLIRLAVKHNLSVYDACCLQAALASQLPLATNDKKLKDAAGENHLVTMTP
ncbi:MAG TPA: type II toxin-antitoxin system VapC family toxin [Terriglobia bacterium]|nr:type II toxin-antitoxin system VapC family toxin [Terriglobia bacterium]